MTAIEIDKALIDIVLEKQTECKSRLDAVECYPDITFLPQLARLLGCSVDDFFD